MVERELITAREIHERCGVPVYAVYRMVKDGRLVAHDMPREAWHKRRRLGFDPDEVAAALALPRL